MAVLNDLKEEREANWPGASSCCVMREIEWFIQYLVTNRVPIVRK